MSDMRQLTALGRSIEDESFAVIDREAGPHTYSPGEWSVVRRVIHATADFEMKELVRFHPDAIRAANTARHVLELCRAASVVQITSEICARVAGHLGRHAGAGVTLEVYLVDFGGTLLGRCPEMTP